MPESRSRKKAVCTPQSTAPEPARFGSASWWAPVMVTFFLVGLAWIVLYYITGNTIPVMKSLGWWNVVVGFAFIGVGFGMSTRWR